MSCQSLALILFGLSAFLVSNASSAPLDGEEIKGGDDADLGDHPYQIVLQVMKQTMCGGSIIAENYVVTAAHCVINIKGDFMGYPLKVVAGTNDLNKKVKNQIEIDVEKVYVPKEYDPTNIYSRSTGDIAILKLKSPINLTSNPNISKIDLPTGASKDFAGVKAVVSGFGVNDVKVRTNPKTGQPEEYDNVSYDKMRYAEADVIAHNKCNQYYSLLKVKTSHICAFVKQRKAGEPEGVCSGDSGGPLAYNNVLIGTVSISPLGCREDSLPAVYTRVSDYLGFINKAMNDKADTAIRTEVLPIV